MSLAWFGNNSSNNRLAGRDISWLVLGTSACVNVVSLAVTFWLWRNLSLVHQRLDALEEDATEPKAASPRHATTSGPPKDVTATEKDHEEEDDVTERSLFVLHGPVPTPELVLTPDTEQVPARFLKAAKGDVEEGRKRFQATLEWRERHEMNTALYRAWPHFELIKANYPHYFYGFSKTGNPVFYEQPPKTNLKVLRQGGVHLKELLQYYAMICEFQWQYVARGDEQQSVYVVDLQGMGMYDFVGECKDFVQQAAAFASAHYPERAGVVLVINVPYWFKMVWNVVRQWLDPVTLTKIFILRGTEEIFQALSEQIPVEHIPKEYGGESEYELGKSTEEQLLAQLMTHNNEMHETGTCPNSGNPEPCRFCTFRYARNY